MAKGIYIGVDGVPKKVKKIFVGVDGVPKKVKKVFIGSPDGTPKLCYSGNQLEKHSAIDMGSFRLSSTGASVGQYGLFAGGATSSSSDNQLSSVLAINSSLVSVPCPDLTSARRYLGGALVGGYALFFGGIQDITEVNTVDAYNGLLVRSNPSSASINRGYVASISTGKHAMFLGGGFASGGLGINTVDAYDMNLVKTSTTLSQARREAFGTAINGYAIVAGGQTASGSTIYLTSVEAFNSSLVRTSLSPLSKGKKNGCAVTIGNYCLFLGGTDDDSPYGASDTIDVYNSSLIKLGSLQLLHKRMNATALNIGEYAVVAGGAAYINGNAAAVTDVEVYNENLIRVEPPEDITANYTYGYGSFSSKAGLYGLVLCNRYLNIYHEG